MKKMVIGLVVLGILGGGAYAYISSNKKVGPAKEQQAPLVVLAPAEVKPLFDSLEAIGTAQANESAELTATVTGRVEMLSIAEGAYAKAGSVLVQLSDAEQKAELDEAARAYERYQTLLKGNVASPARRDEERARMRIAEAKVSDRRILVPFDGFLGLRRVSVGDLVTPGTILTTIDDIDPIKLEFTVPETYLSTLSAGMDIVAQSNAWPGKQFEGQVSVVDTRVDPVTRAVSVRALIENPDLQLRPGMLLTTVLIKNRREGIVIPESALNPQGDRQYVFVVGADGKAVEREVVLGVRSAGSVEIVKGLQANEMVIADGGMSVRNGQTVKTADQAVPEQQAEPKQ